MEKTGDEKSRDTVPVTQNGVNNNYLLVAFQNYRLLSLELDMVLSTF